MAVGQGVLAPVLDVAALTVLEGRVEVLALDRCAAHAARLRAVLAMHAVFTKAGVRESTTATLALLEQSSEQAACNLLEQALLLTCLPGGLEAVECALLSEQQAAAVTRKLLPASAEVQLAVWARLQAQLLAAFEQGVVLPPGRLGELVAGWVITVDAAAAAARRKAASKDGAVSYRRRDDGLVDITVFGLSGPDAQTVLSRIRDRSGPWGSHDDRTDGARRRDAAVSLWLGRDQQPLRDSLNPFHDDDTALCPCAPAGVAAGGARCGCRNGEAVPCGIGVTLLLPLGAALGTTDELAVLQGHGPIEPDLARAVLHNAPVIRPVWVDEHGVAVAVGDATSSPPRGDPAAVRHALLSLAASQPPRLHPRHPDDHPGPVAPQTCSAVRLGWWQRPVQLPQLLTRPHPTGTPGAYRPSTRLVRLLRARSPHCEWPGCGQWAVRCDLDHDLAHPEGPTCACNLGPLCRHHHRLKQSLLHKTRRNDGVHWTSPTGRHWLRPLQGQPPEPPVRPLPPLPDPDSPDSPDSPERDGSTDHAWQSGRTDTLRADDPHNQPEPDHDTYRLVRPTGWGPTLDDPTHWGC